MDLLKQFKEIDFLNYNFKYKPKEIPGNLFFQEEILEFKNLMKNYRLTEMELQTINYAFLEISMRLNDLETFKEYFHKIRPDDFITPNYACYSQKLELKEFEHYIDYHEDDDEYDYEDEYEEKEGYYLNYPLYRKFFQEIGSSLHIDDAYVEDEIPLEVRPLESEDYNHFYFDQIIMLFIVALEGRDIKKYISKFILDEYNNPNQPGSSLMDRVAYLEKVEFAKYLLEQGVDAPTEFYTGSSEIQNLFEKSINEVRVKQNFHPRFSDSPSYDQILEWINQYKSLYYVTATFTGKSKIFILSTKKDVLNLMDMDKSYYGESIALLKDTSQAILEFKNQKSIDKQPVYSFLEKNSILYANYVPKESTLGTFLDIAYRIAGTRNDVPLHRYAATQSRDFTEADMWSQVYQDQKDYNENH